MWTWGWSPAVTGQETLCEKDLQFSELWLWTEQSKALFALWGFLFCQSRLLIEGKHTDFTLFSGTFLLCVLHLVHWIHQEADSTASLTKPGWFDSTRKWGMTCLRCWLTAVALLLLSVARVNMEHLQAENLNLLPPDEHNLVLNRGMRGILVCVSLSVWLVFLAVFLYDFPNSGWWQYRAYTVWNSLTIAFKCWISFISDYLCGFSSGCGSNSRLYIQIALWLINDKCLCYEVICVP